MAATVESSGREPGSRLHQLASLGTSPGEGPRGAGGHQHGQPAAATCRPVWCYYRHRLALYRQSSTGSRCGACSRGQWLAGTSARGSLPGRGFSKPARGGLAAAAAAARHLVHDASRDHRRLVRVRLVSLDGSTLGADARGTPSVRAPRGAGGGAYPPVRFVRGSEWHPRAVRTRCGPYATARPPRGRGPAGPAPGMLCLADRLCSSATPCGPGAPPGRLLWRSSTPPVARAISGLRRCISAASTRRRAAPRPSGWRAVFE